MSTNNDIQKIIDNAQAGDTILFTGLQYTHIHLSINKPLNIISNVSTQLYACPMQIPVGSDDLTAFAIYDGASGTNISGFKINNNNNGYGIYINNTSKINVSNNIVTCNNGTGINIINSNSVSVYNNTMINSNSGIKISNSNLTHILKNSISNNNENGILFGVNDYNTIVDQNNITSNKLVGINVLESCNNVTITKNSIAQNYNNGIYVNSTIAGLNISSNFIYKNGIFGLCYDLGVTELTQNTETVNNNYINGHSGRDVIRFVNTTDVTAPVWLGETCFGGLNNVCPKVQVSSQAVMSKINQIAPGKYSVSVIDKNTGLICKEFGSFYITFFLNKNDTTKGDINPGDTWKDVLVTNGTATVDFTKYNYKTTNNTIFAIAPYQGFNNAMKDLFMVKDSDIPKLDLSASYSIGKNIIKTGDTTIYQLQIKNKNNRDATGVKVKNILSTSYYSSYAKAPRGSYSNGVWNIGTLKAGETLSLSVYAKAIKSGTTKSQAQITGTNINTLYSSTITKTINKNVKLSYANAVSSSGVKLGSYVYLTTKVSNSGLDVSDPVKIKMSLPSGMRLVSVSSPSWYNKTTGTWTFRAYAGKTYTFTTKAKVTSKGTKTVTYNNNGKTQVKYIKGY